MAFWENLPPELFVDLALKHLTPTDIITFCSNQEVKFAQEICSDQEFWKIFYRRDFSLQMVSDYQNAYKLANGRTQGDSLIYWALKVPYERISLDMELFKNPLRQPAIVKLIIEGNLTALQKYFQVYGDSVYRIAINFRKFELNLYRNFAAFFGQAHILGYLLKEFRKLPLDDDILISAAYGLKDREMVPFILDLISSMGGNPRELLQRELSNISQVNMLLAQELLNTYGPIQNLDKIKNEAKLINAMKEDNYREFSEIIDGRKFIINNAFYVALALGKFRYFRDLLFRGKIYDEDFLKLWILTKALDLEEFIKLLEPYREKIQTYYRQLMEPIFPREIIVPIGDEPPIILPENLPLPMAELGVIIYDLKEYYKYVFDSNIYRWDILVNILNRFKHPGKSWFDQILNNKSGTIEQKIQIINFIQNQGYKPSVQEYSEAFMNVFGPLVNRDITDEDLEKINFLKTYGEITDQRFLYYKDFMIKSLRSRRIKNPIILEILRTW